MKIVFLFLAMAALLKAEPRTISLVGTVTNTTGEITAPASLEITQDGDKISAKLVTAPPLSGTGVLTGRCLDGWCDLSGNLDGGFTAKFRGVLNARAFRGTYVVTPKQGQTQYGRFDFSPAPSVTK